jgi:hypothetical protein
MQLEEEGRPGFDRAKGELAAGLPEVDFDRLEPVEEVKPRVVGYGYPEFHGLTS